MEITTKTNKGIISEGYDYKTNKGEISLIKILPHMVLGSRLWEIYSGETLFEDVERFSTKEEAEVRIKELLE